MTKFIEFGRRLLDDEEGATAIEYGLLAALISVGIIVAVSAIGDQLQTTFETIDTTMADETAEED